MLRTVRNFLRVLFRGRDLDRELDAELGAHVEELTARYLARGMSPSAARRAALVEVGGVEQVKERVRDVRVGWRLETLLRDIAYGRRMIGRAPGFSAVVVLTIALVIGANATVFSVLYAVLWRELPYPEAHRLVLVDADARGIRSAGISHAEASELRAEAGLFDGLATLVSVDAHVIAEDEWERVPAASATDDALRLLGAEPLASGRLLEARRDEGERAVRSAVISHDLWRRRFKSIRRSSADMSRSTISISKSWACCAKGFVCICPQTRRFQNWSTSGFPSATAAIGEIAGRQPLRGWHRASRSRRLKPASMSAHTRAMSEHRADYAEGALRLFVQPLREVLTAEVRPALRVLAGAVGFVLLIGCVNLFNLMLARSRAREMEIAVRRALGASRGRLAAQLFTETALLAAIGAAAGLALAHGGVALLDWLRPSHLPRQSQITVNFTVTVFTTVLAILVSVAVGLAPALRHSAQSENEPLRAGRASVQRPGMRRLQRGLVIAEVALSIVPLVAAGLMLRTFVNLTNAPIGFKPDGVQTAKIAFSFRLFPEPAQRLQLHREAIDLVRRIRGVESVSLGSPLPFDDNQFTRNYGASDNATLQPRATLQTIFPGYLETTGVQLRVGRDFTMDDLASDRPVVIIDERIAAQLWPEGAVGKQLAVSRGRRTVALEIVGVTNAVRMTRVRDDEMPHMFVPYHFFPIEMAVVAKTRRSIDSVGPEIKRAVESLNTRRPVYNLLPIRRYVERSTGDTRFTMLVLVCFGAASLLLAAVGVYGTLAYLTSQRTQEFGVRMALGASAARVLRTVAGEGLWLAVAGGLAGFAGAAMLSSWLRDLLYGVAPFDAATLVATAALIVTVALIAAAHPAWRAARIDPVSALRAE